MSNIPAHCAYLQEYIGQPCHEGVTPSPKAVFILDKATRDRLVLLDMHLAPLIRRYVALDDIERAVVHDSQRFLLALPAGWTQRTCNTQTAGQQAWQCIADYAPALSRHLALHVADRPHHDSYWWELDADTDLPAPHQQCVTWRIDGTKVIFAQTAPGMVSAAPWFVATQPWLVALLNSTAIQRWLNRADGTNRQAPASVAQLPVPVTLAKHTEFAQLATQQHELAQRRLALSHAGVQALVRNFAPLGAKVTAPIRNWMNHDFERLRKALRGAFHNDIPERHWAEWQQWLDAAQFEYQQTTKQLQQIDTHINAVVNAHLPPPQG